MNQRTWSSARPSLLPTVDEIVHGKAAFDRETIQEPRRRCGGSCCAVKGRLPWP